MRLAIAVASYGADQAAFELAKSVASQRARTDLAGIAIIDSGALDRPASLRERNRLPGHVEYLQHEGNLGAAGNLFRRLSWARSLNAEVLLAVNADGIVDPSNTDSMCRLMVETGAAAVYPTAVLVNGTVDLSYIEAVPALPRRASLAALEGLRAVKVVWGSSNGALYRVGCLDWVDWDRVLHLWHGWEDLAVGLALCANGHDQYIDLEALQTSASDQRQLGRSGPVVSDKPAWTAYYTFRNLVLLANSGHLGVLRVTRRLLREIAAMPLRADSLQRLRFAWAGLRDGLADVGGMAVDPGTR